MKQRLPVLLFGTLWLVAVVIGMGILFTYERIPAEETRAPLLWPADSRLEPAKDQSTLVMFAHPRCPCTGASLTELAEMMKHSHGLLKAYVLFLQPAGTEHDWTQTDHWRTATAIPGVTVLIDPLGREAQHFHATTSGQVAVYDHRRHLQYNGGITPARGQTGDRVWRASLLTIAGGRSESFHAQPVYGCSLCETHPQTRESALP